MDRDHFMINDRGRQVPSLTPCNTLHPDGRHVSTSREVVVRYLP